MMQRRAGWALCALALGIALVPGCGKKDEVAAPETGGATGVANQAASRLPADAPPEARAAAQNAARAGQIQAERYGGMARARQGGGK